MTTPLPPASDYTGAAVTQGGKKTFMTSVRTFLADLLGTTGTAADARTALGVLAKAGDSLTGALNEARATVASAATTADIWGAAGNQINFTGTATVTNFPAAPQAGAKRRLICASTPTFTNNANIQVQGAANFTAASGDTVEIEAITTTVFKATIFKLDGKAVVSTLPTQTGNSGKALVTNGTVESWGYPAQLSTASGSAPSYAARAWVNFNGTGTIAIRASGNVTSITDNGTGNYSVNFTTAMSDANFTVAHSTDTDSSSVNQFVVGASPRTLHIQENLKSTSGFQLFTGSAAAGGSTLLDFIGINLVIMR